MFFIFSQIFIFHFVSLSFITAQEMSAVVKVKVLAARNLPVMDRTSYLTDAFVEVCSANIVSVRFVLGVRCLKLMLSEER